MLSETLGVLASQSSTKQISGPKVEVSQQNKVQKSPVLYYPGINLEIWIGIRTDNPDKSL